MSQLIFTATMDGQEVCVHGGYDRPLREFFLSVLNRDGEVIANDLSIPIRERRDLDTFRELLADWGIAAVEDFWVLMDRKEGNVFYSHEGGMWVRKD